MIDNESYLDWFLDNEADLREEFGGGSEADFQTFCRQEYDNCIYAYEAKMESLLN